jgi:hypothetical protein
VRTFTKPTGGAPVSQVIPHNLGVIPKALAAPGLNRCGTADVFAT